MAGDKAKSTHSTVDKYIELVPLTMVKEESFKMYTRWLKENTGFKMYTT
jgi:hypothetical protein